MQFILEQTYFYRELIVVMIFLFSSMRLFLTKKHVFMLIYFTIILMCSFLYTWYTAERITAIEGRTVEQLIDIYDFNMLIAPAIISSVIFLLCCGSWATTGLITKQFAYLSSARLLNRLQNLKANSPMICDTGRALLWIFLCYSLLKYAGLGLVVLSLYTSAA